MALIVKCRKSRKSSPVEKMKYSLKLIDKLCKIINFVTNIQFAIHYPEITVVLMASKNGKLGVSVKQIFFTPNRLRKRIFFILVVFGFLHIYHHVKLLVSSYNER